MAIPNFWFAMMLVLIFAINLRWFSAGGFAGWDKGFFAAMKSLTLPAIALALPQAAILARVTTFWTSKNHYDENVLKA